MSIDWGSYEVTQDQQTGKFTVWEKIEGEKKINLNSIEEVAAWITNNLLAAIAKAEAGQL